MREKEFRKLKGWIDYERHLLPQLTPAQRIKYFRKRLNLVLLKPLQSMFKNIQDRKKHSSALLCWATCICCAIEALGKFYSGKTGRNGSEERFNKYIKQFMNPQFTQKTFDRKSYRKILWKSFRNGLAHGFAIKRGGFEFQRNYFETKPLGGISQLEIDPRRFHTDFKRSVEAYLRQVTKASKNSAMYRKFNKAFEDIFIHGL